MDNNCDYPISYPDQDSGTCRGLRLRTFIVRFSNEIQFQDIKFLRGAVINATPNGSLLFHNHVGDGGYRYRYPLIQYKRIGGKAAIVCVGDGTEAIGEFLTSCEFEMRLGNQMVTLELDSVKAEKTLVQRWDGQFNYVIRKFLPFNQTNYKLYMELPEGSNERTDIIRRSLVGNILSFAKTFGLHFDEEVIVEIKEIGNPYVYTYKKVKLLGFDLSFTCNVSLPNYIGLGKNASQGFGVVMRGSSLKINKSDNI